MDQFCIPSVIISASKYDHLGRWQASCPSCQRLTPNGDILCIFVRKICISDIFIVKHYVAPEWRLAGRVKIYKV